MQGPLYEIEVGRVSGKWKLGLTQGLKFTVGRLAGVDQATLTRGKKFKNNTTVVFDLNLMFTHSINIC